jgi:cholesterol oxidase
MFGKTNLTAMLHLGAIARAGHVVGAAGTEDYLPHPSRFRIPTLFIHGERNRCFRPEGTAKTRDWLAAVNGAHLYERSVIRDTGHIDCIFGRNSARDVFPLIVRHLLAS